MAPPKKKKTPRRSTMTRALRELAIDSDSDMEPEDDFFPPDRDDFAAESSDEAVLDGPVYFCVKKI